MSECSLGHVVIIGVGLIGGSLARALKAHDAVSRITGVARSQETLDLALQMGVIDNAESDPVQAMKDADLVVLASPVSTIAPILEAIADTIPAHCVVTDAGSVKGSVARAAREALGEKIDCFVPGHPIAGTENSGVAASFAELFVDHRVILTPLAENAETDIQLVQTMWEVCGARVVRMSVEHHDAMLGATSHLPHLLAYSLVDFLSQQDRHDEIFANTAGGFRDFTRIAASSPVMWQDICLANRDVLIPLLKSMEQQLAGYRALLEKSDGEQLQQAFLRAKTARDKLPEVTKVANDE
ncbi:MAG: prephenate dehydrogenase/arogenate dehydrogenase family protein [Pseudomonadota bacterium]|nr:prephenate dehydrogenase/arogenate dehydrogenase family protein [Pseudomonadota bacterium]